MAVSLDDWAKYVPHRTAIGEMLDTRFYSIGWVDEQILSGAARVWANDTACIVAQINVFPAGGREVHGLVAVGDLQAILMLIPHAERWGAERGCTVASISSREGWAKVLEPVGYQPYQVTVRKELDLAAGPKNGYQGTMRGDK